MSMRKATALLSLLTLSVCLTASANTYAATPAAAWDIQSLSTPTAFLPGEDSGEDRYQVFITNSGGKATDQSPITITDTLPRGLGVKDVELRSPRGGNPIISSGCKAPVTTDEVTTVSCEVTNALQPVSEPARLDPGNILFLEVKTEVPPAAAGTLVNRVEVSGGEAKAVTEEFENQASAEDAKAGFEEFEAQLTGPDGLPATGADARPYQFTTTFALNTVTQAPGSLAPVVAAGGNLREVEVALPPGLAGNPAALTRCTAQQFNTNQGEAAANLCPDSSAVGLAVIQQLEGVTGSGGAAATPIYNLVPPEGMPAQLGFRVLEAPIYINTRVRSDGDYGISAYLENVTEAQRVTAARMMLWGVPWEGSHDTQRGFCASAQKGSCPVEGEGDPLPFLRLPSSCQSPLLSVFNFGTWAQPAATAGAEYEEAAPEECARPDFSPSVEAQPSTDVADSPSGIQVEIQMPVRAHEEPKDPEGNPIDPESEPGEADLKDVSVRLPRELGVNAASADGLAACSPTQIGLQTPPGQQSPIHFDKAPARCPDAAKLGTVEADVPALGLSPPLGPALNQPRPIKGSVYLATQEDNPFNSLIALYIVLEDPLSGVVVKLAAKVSADPLTGQLTTTTTDAPQVPVEDFRFDFFAGARAPLRTPQRCGPYSTTAAFTPWTAPAGAGVERSDPFAIGAGPAGPCPSGAPAPKLSAGLANPTANTYSPFSARLTRPDGSEEFSALDVATPTAMTAKLAGIPYCPEAAIAQAVARSGPRQGALEAASPSCPAASRVGTTTAGAGAGPTPFYASGKVYLAGPYKGAPISFVAVVPALAGPFDLGTIVNRIAVHIDPETAQVSAQSDPLPRILFGIGLDVRDVRVDIDRAGFTLAGTSCDPDTVVARVTGVSGVTSTANDRFQLGGCGALRFGPTVSLKLSGGTKRSAHPSLRAVVTYPPGSRYANTASASVGLPHSEFLDQAHIRTICTRVQFAAKACPKGSVYGKAKAFTPLLDKPLEGPIYLRSSSNPLPDLVLALHGQIDVAAAARIDSHNGGIRTSFKAVPDAPLTKVIVEMQGGKKGLLVNSRNICRHTNRATARFTAHNGKSSEGRPVLRDGCGKGGKRKG
jgi:hypothetical protein